MSYSFNLAGNGDALQIARVRSLIDDVTSAGSPVEGTDYFLSDARIMDMLAAATSLVSGEWPLVWQAASFALSALATNQAYVLSVYKGKVEEFDGARVADSIRADARMWENRAARGVGVAQAAASATATPPLAAADGSVSTVTVW
jgi:hypothetical protein